MFAPKQPTTPHAVQSSKSFGILMAEATEHISIAEICDEHRRAGPQRSVDRKALWAFRATQ
jgi:hypothetical protein